MKDYLKTQWFDLLMGVLNLGFWIYYACIESWYWAVMYFILAVTWFIMSRVDHNELRIQRLERTQSVLEDENKNLYEFQRISQEKEKAQEERIRCLQYQIETLTRRR